MESVSDVGLLYTKVQVSPNKYLHIINTHLNSSYLSIDNPQLEESEIYIDTRKE